MAAPVLTEQEKRSMPTKIGIRMSYLELTIEFLKNALRNLRNRDLPPELTKHLDEVLVARGGLKNTIQYLKELFPDMESKI